MKEVLQDEFMIAGYHPSRLPTSCLTMAPRFDRANMNMMSLRGPLTEINKDTRAVTTSSTGSIKSLKSGEPSDCYLVELQKQLKSLVDSKPSSKYPLMEDEAEDPKCLPMIWVSKWVDYSDKYGFGYALSDESIGVLFNDVTKLLLLSDGR